MRNNILGFSQLDLVSLGLDLTDAMILRYFVDFQGSPKMKQHIINDEVYYWLGYQKIIDDLPLINIASTETIRRRIDKLVNAEVLKKETISTKGGRKTYLKLGQNYTPLLLDNERVEKINKKESKDPRPITEWFEKFWKMYPKKVNKGKALNEFSKQVKDEDIFKEIMEDLKKRKQYQGWLNDNGKYVPHAENYLKRLNWLDEYEAKEKRKEIGKVW